MVVESDRPQRIARLTPLADALACIDAVVKPVAARACDLSGALGRILAEDVVANAPIPAVARALRDGWAVRSELTTDAGTYAPAPLPAAARIDVGQPLAGDADAVTPLDALTVRNGIAQALAPVGPGDGVLSAGADVAAFSIENIGRQREETPTARGAGVMHSTVHAAASRSRSFRIIPAIHGLVAPSDNIVISRLKFEGTQ